MVEREAISDLSNMYRLLKPISGAQQVLLDEVQAHIKQRGLQATEGLKGESVSKQIADFFSSTNFVCVDMILFLSNYTTKLYVIFTKKVENISLILSVIERRNITKSCKSFNGAHIRSQIAVLPASILLM